jgi:hypothetical protein
MEDRRAQARALAGEALSELSTPGHEIELIMRKALRVAALRGHAFQQAWFQLQLINLEDAARDKQAIRQSVEAQLRDRETAARVTDDAILDYMDSRTLKHTPTKVFGSSIRELARIVGDLEEDIARATTPPPNELRTAATDMRRALDGIVNRTQTYLVGIETD